MPRRRRLPPDTRPRWQDVPETRTPAQVRCAYRYTDYDMLPASVRRKYWENQHGGWAAIAAEATAYRTEQILKQCEEIKESIQQQDAAMEAAVQRIQGACDRIDRQLAPKVVTVAEQACNELAEARKPGFFSKLLHRWRG